MIKKFLLFVFLISIASAAAVFPASGTDVLVICNLSEKNTEMYNSINSLIREICRRTGVSCEIISYPPVRSSVMLQKGQIDMEALRAFEYGELSSDIIRVDEPVFYLNTAVYSLNKDYKFKNFEEVVKSSKSVGYKRGFKKFEAKLKTAGKSETRCQQIDGTEQAIRMLESGRFELLIDVKETINPVLKKYSLSSNKIFMNGIIDTNSMHLYVNKNHSGIVPALNRAVINMRKDGTIRKYTAAIE